MLPVRKLVVLFGREEEDKGDEADISKEIKSLGVSDRC